MPSQLVPVYIEGFKGMDSYRDPISNVDRGTGQLAVNMGRETRGALQPRRSLTRTMSSNGNNKLSQRAIAIGALPIGHTLHLLVRTTGGTLVPVKDVR